MNQDENKNRVKDIDAEKDKEMDEKDEKIDEKISRNSHLIFDRDAIYTKFSGLGRPLVI